MKLNRRTDIALRISTILVFSLIGGTLFVRYQGAKSYIQDTNDHLERPAANYSDRNHNLYVACKNIPVDERGRFHWEMIMNYEYRYEEIRNIVQTHVGDLHPTFAEEMMEQKKYIEMFPHEEYPSYEEMNEMPEKMNFSRGQFAPR